MNIALLTAAGIGSRMGQEFPKQFLHVEDRPVIIHTMEIFQQHPGIDAILAVTLSSWIDVLQAYARQYGITKLCWIVPGGSTGQESIYNGLRALEDKVDLNTAVMIHDGNRCSVSSQIISDSLATYNMYGCAVAAIPCVEAVFKSTDDGVSSTVSIPREQLFRTQTPHTYSLGKLLWAYGEAEKRGIKNSVAVCTLMQMLGETIYFSKGAETNIKLTTPDDLEIFKALLALRDIGARS